MISVFLKCDCGYERTMDHGPQPDEALTTPIYQQQYKVCTSCQEVKSVRRPIAENIRLAIEEREVLDPEADSAFFENGVAEMSTKELKALLASSTAGSHCPDCHSDKLKDVEYGDDYRIVCPRCAEEMEVRDLIDSD